MISLLQSLIIPKLLKWSPLPPCLGISNQGFGNWGLDHPIDSRRYTAAANWRDDVSNVENVEKCIDQDTTIIVTSRWSYGHNINALIWKQDNKTPTWLGLHHMVWIYDTFPPTLQHLTIHRANFTISFLAAVFVACNRRTFSTLRFTSKFQTVQWNTPHLASPLLQARCCFSLPLIYMRLAKSAIEPQPDRIISVTAFRDDINNAAFYISWGFTFH